MPINLIPDDEILVPVCADLLFFLEGERLKPYRDAGGVWTIGDGETVINGHPVGPNTPPLSAALAKEDLVQGILQRTSFLRTNLLNPDNYQQFTLDRAASLVSFCYNEGEAAFNGSTLRKMIQFRDMDAAALEFPRWNLVGGQANLGLERRRRREQVLFMNLYSITEVLNGAFDPDPLLGLKALPERAATPLEPEAIQQLLTED
ncbi:MAG TPA: lysozyme [Terriglobia bacterium]|nr:lysozyme [Terriglobia bacterium]